jgi:hypothetical protein
MKKILKYIGVTVVIILVCVVFYNALLRWTFVYSEKQGGVWRCDKWTGYCELQ